MYYLMPKPSLKNNSSDIIYFIAGRNREDDTLSETITLNGSLIACVEIELAY